MTSLTPHQLKALDHKNHISLTANAGSGKTFVLSRRYLEIALSENLSLRNIAAITFTDKAAGELYKKIASLIEDRLSASTESAEIKRLENIRRQLVSANISTIHSFCIDILREFPVEAGLDANFTPVDETASGELIELSVDEMIKAALNNPDEEQLLKYLIRLFASKNQLAKELIRLINHRKNVLSISESLYSGSEEETASKLHELFLDYAERIFLKDKEKLTDSIERINSAVIANNKKSDTAAEALPLISKMNAAGGTEEYLAAILNVKSAVTTGKGTLRLTGYINKAVKEEMNAEIEIVNEFFADIGFLNIPEDSAELEADLARFGKTLITFFEKALAVYERKKKENGYLDYEDILLQARNILTNEHVQNSLAQKFKYIMVDEYQDTNEIQYNIFLPILNHLKQGNLFIVGDEKQSIYMFRDAELQVFNKTRKDIEESSGSEFLLSLPDSFRMAPALCLFTNYVFTRLFAGPREIFNEVTHTDLVCAREDGVEGKIEFLIAGESDNEKVEEHGVDSDGNASAENPEADLVARRIVSLIKDDELSPGVNWGDIAVLCRKRKAFSGLEKTFINYNIPFVIVGGKGFYQRQAIYDIYNYFSFLLDAKNDTALTGILRSPFFTLSDSLIFDISLSSGDSLWHKLQNYSGKNNYAKLAAERLGENLALAKSTDIPEMLRKILKESDFLAVLASGSNGEQELANIQKLITLAISFSRQGFRTLYDYVEYLRESIELSGDEAQASVTEESDAVKIMTLHQAKGLEYPAVFLYKCDDITRKSTAKTKEVIVSKTFGILTKLPRRQDYFAEYESAPVLGINDFINSKKNRAELKRLLYVGITRAKNYLFISATAPRKEKYNSESFMALLQEGLGNELSGDRIKLNSSLNFLTEKDGNYVTEERSVLIDVPIIRELKLEPFVENNTGPDKVHQKLATAGIKDSPEGEIISATKVAVYKQCPLKYQFTYGYGFGPLMTQFKMWSNSQTGDDVISSYEFSPEEAYNDPAYEEKIGGGRVLEYAELKGRIIHKALQRELQLNDIKEFTEVSARNEINPAEVDENKIKKLRETVYSDLKKFYGSQEYKFISSFKNYSNEYEVYIKQGDYYLYGIIDKLIFEKNKLVIVDYKTDDIPVEEIDERSEAYLTQLIFYSYIVTQLFDSIKEYSLRLIFIKHPDRPVIKEVGSDNFKILKDEIERMIKNIREEKFRKNIRHCPKCAYSLNQAQCIKS